MDNRVVFEHATFPPTKQLREIRKAVILSTARMLDMIADHTCADIFFVSVVTTYLSQFSARVSANYYVHSEYLPRPTR